MPKRACRGCGQLVQTKFCAHCGLQQFQNTHACIACGDKQSDRDMKIVHLYFDDRASGQRTHYQRFYCRACGSELEARMTNMLQNPFEMF